MTLVAAPRLLDPARSAAPWAVAAGFELAPGVAEVLPAFRERCTVVRLASLDNETLGIARWATLEEAWCEPGSRRAELWARNPVVTVGPQDDPRLVLATGMPVLVVGADTAFTPWARAVVDGVRATCPWVLAVDMGLRPGPGYADIATRGHDRERGAALLALLSAR